MMCLSCAAVSLVVLALTGCTGTPSAGVRIVAAKLTPTDLSTIRGANYRGARAAISNDIARAKAFAAKAGKQVMNSEIGCIARANPYDVTLEEHMRAGVGWYIWDRYCLYVARNIGAQPRADINLTARPRNLVRAGTPRGHLVPALGGRQERHGDKPSPPLRSALSRPEQLYFVNVSPSPQ